MHLLLTRPKSEDDQLPGLLQSKGHTFLSDPVLSVEFVTPGHSAGVVVADVLVLLLDRAHQVTFHDLHVVDVVEKLHAR